MTVKYVSADTSGLEKPERLVPDTDFMTPIRDKLGSQNDVDQNVLGARDKTDHVTA